MSEIDDFIEDTRAQLVKAKDAAQGDAKQAVQKQLEELADFEDMIDLGQLLDEAAQLNALSDVLDHAIATIQHNVSNFFLDDLLELKREVDQKLGKPVEQLHGAAVPGTASHPATGPGAVSLSGGPSAAPPSSKPGASASSPGGAPASMPTDVAMVPASHPVEFGALSDPVSNDFWPVITDDPQAIVVSYQTTSGAVKGSGGRRFLAQRAGGARHHVGIDVFCREGDVVVACAGGKIVNFYGFYTRPTTGEVTFALFIAHDGVVINYGEVRANARQEFGWSINDTVKAGQKIARVSGTNMIHFETYAPGTDKNARWMTGDPQPSNLRNPTKLLLSLIASGKRILTNGDIIAGSGASALAGSSLATDFPGSRPGNATWHSKFGGREWRYDERGVFTRDSGTETLLRTNGAPITCREIFKLYGAEIVKAATKHNVNPALIMMTIATETAFARDQKFTGPTTFRWEAQVDNTDVSPTFKGSYSAGPMQCLAATTREMLVKFGAQFGLSHHQPFVVAPAINPQPLPPPNSHPLYDGATNIDIGTGEIRMRVAASGDDPVLVAACFNAGGLHEDTTSPWGLRAHGDHLDRAARWYGDACEVLSENGFL